jgi:hypothetical protein
LARFLAPDDLVVMLRVREILVVLRADFLAPVTLWVRDIVLRELADFFAAPLDFFLLEEAPVLPVVDLMLADLALLEILAFLPDFLVERLFLLTFLSLSLLLLILCLAAPSLPNSLVM